MSEKIKQQFFFVKRKCMDLLENDLEFQKQLTKKTEKFIKRRIKGAKFMDTRNSDSDPSGDELININ